MKAQSEIRARMAFKPFIAANGIERKVGLPFMPIRETDNVVIMNGGAVQ